MTRDLLNPSEFYVITFPSTQSALQAEKILEEAGENFLLIPTPGKISAGCGLSVKCLPEDKQRIVMLLKRKGVSLTQVYYLRRNR